jgi:ATP-dependent Lon protease
MSSEVVDLTEPAREPDAVHNIPAELAVIPINDGVVFPFMLVPLILTDENLIALIDEALGRSKMVGVFTQKDPQESSPGPGGIHHIGCAMLIQNNRTGAIANRDHGVHRRAADDEGRGGAPSRDSGGW